LEKYSVYILVSSHSLTISQFTLLHMNAANTQVAKPEHFLMLIYNFLRTFTHVQTFTIYIILFL